MKKIITTVGTSLITNAIDDNQKVKKRPYKDLQTKSYSQSNESSLKNLINSIKDGLSIFIKSENINLSAEIASIIKIAQQEPTEIFEVYLIATDTILSPICAEYIQKWFENNKEIYSKISFYNKITIIQKLRIEKPDSDKENSNYFYEGFQALIEKLLEFSKNDKENTIFNITGGYKGIIPIITIISQLEGIKLNYLFEESNDLIEIPVMSIDFDFSLVEDNYLAFESIKANKSIKNLPTKEQFLKLLINQKDFDVLYSKFQIIELLDNDKVALSLFGRLLFEKYEELYNKDLLARQKLLGEVIEYKLYEYFIEKEKDSEVIKGKNLGKENYDIDIFIERNNEIEAIEVKPGGNIPIENKKNNSIEYRLIEGSFKYLTNNYRKNKYIFHLIAYYHENIHEVVINKLKTLYNEQNYAQNVVLKLSLLKVPDNYKKNVNWKISKNMIHELILKKI